MDTTITMSDWWQSLKNAFEVTELSDRRQKQLTLEKWVDKGLKRECKECNQDVQQYLFHMRKLHRVNSQKIYEAPFYEYPTKYKEYMDKVDEYQKPLYNAFPSDPYVTFDTCKIVKELNEKLEKEL